jgi:hypothetical protein
MRITKVKYLHGYKLLLTIDGLKGLKKKIDLESFLKSSTHPLIHKYLDKKKFKNAYIDERGALCWGDNEFDINPESIFNDEFTISD